MSTGSTTSGSAANSSRWKSSLSLKVWRACSGDKAPGVFRPQAANATSAGRSMYRYIGSSRLKNDFQRELHDAGSARAGQPAEVRIGQTSYGIAEIGPVDQIERFEAQLARSGLAQKRKPESLD